MGTVILAVSVASLLGAPAMAATVVDLGKLPQIPIAFYYDAEGQLLYEVGIEPSHPGIGYTKHFLHVGATSTDAKGGKPGGGGGDPGTDCEPDDYRLGGWQWNSAYSGKASSYASQLNSAGNTWDSETSANIFGGINGGSSATAGQLDGVNQHDFVNLGGGSTVAVTSTWYYRGSGEAVESDAQYNTAYPWATNGASNSMDVLHVATHEIGHTFGLNHPSTKSSNGCLTMYAYVNYGDTHGRTLGDGDILGIRAIYGS